MFRLLLALLVIVAFMAGRTPTVSRPDYPSTGEPRRVGAPNKDLYGNPVERAIGGYRVDPRGDLYEEHNPDTAVLDLGPPSS
jgi:hypothetical protein